MFDFKNKSGNIASLNNYMLAKTIPMFEWENLPETIPYGELEKMLQVNGYAFIARHEGELYAFNGGLGGEPDVYGNSTTLIVANPYLKLNKEFNLKDDGVLISNDNMRLGLLKLYEKFNSMIVENDINLTVHGFASRMQILLSASDDKTKESAEQYIKKIIDGDVSIIAENAIFDGIKTHSISGGSTNTSKNLIEYSQFLKASLYNEIGLSANTNLKRERLVSAEVEQGEDSLFPLVYSMLKCRVDAVDKINDMFGTDIKVALGSVWHLKHIEMVDNAVEIVENNDDEQISESPENGIADSDINADSEGDTIEVEEIETVEVPETVVDESEDDEKNIN